MFFKLTEFKHNGGKVIISDPCFDNTSYSNSDCCINADIYHVAAAQRRRATIDLPQGEYVCEQNSSQMDIRILEKSAYNSSSSYEKCNEKLVSTGFSSNICICNEKLMGDSQQFSFNPAEVQFRASDMLELIKRNNIQASRKSVILLQECIANGNEFPFASILDDTLLSLIDNIPNTIWSNHVMIETHTNSESYTIIPGGIAFRAPTFGCKCYTLENSTGICGIYLDYNINENAVTFIDNTQKDFLINKSRNP